MVPLKIPYMFIMVIFISLVEDKLRVIDNPGDHKLINFVVIKSTMTLLRLAVVYSFEILYDFLLLS